MGLGTGRSTETTTRRLREQASGSKLPCSHSLELIRWDSVYNYIHFFFCRYAIRERGVNIIDTSPFYGEGLSELVIGRALRGIPRDQFFVATKVGRYRWDLGGRFDFTADRVTRSIEESLARLQLDHVDILQVHDLEFASSVDVIISETLPAVQRLKERGVCRFIGITGYPLEPLKEVVSRSKVKIDSVLSYSRLTLNDPSLVEHFSFFRSHGVSIINAAPLALGLLTPQGPQLWNPALGEIKEACAGAVQYSREQGVDITRLAVHFSVNHEEVWLKINCHYFSFITSSDKCAKILLPK